MTTVVVADDQRVVRDGLALMLGLLPDVDLVGTASNGQEALELAASRRVDVILMDLRMPVLNGIEATRRLRRQHPGTSVVVLTTYADDDSIFAALEAGARGYLTKDAAPEEIADALARVTAGEVALDGFVQARLVERTERRPDASGPANADVRIGLTPRELEVLGLIADGLSNAEIGDRLNVSQATVKTHVNHLLRKVGLRDRTQAASYAYRHFLTPSRATWEGGLVSARGGRG